MKSVQEFLGSTETSKAGDSQPRDISKRDRLIVVLFTVVTSILLFRPFIADFNVWRGDQYAHAGQVEDAARAYRKAVLLNADNSRAHDGLGYTYEALGRPNEAIAEYEKAVEISPDEAFHHYIIGISRLRRKEYRPALGHLREAARLEPYDFNHLRALASAYRSLGHERKAREIMNEIKERFNIRAKRSRRGRV